jgi:hypothetical protein
MKQLLTILLALFVALPIDAQKKRNAKNAHPAATTHKKTSSKTKPGNKAKAVQPAKKGVKTTKTPAKKTAKSVPQKGNKTSNKRGNVAKAKNTQSATDKAIKGLQGQREAIKKKIQQQEAALRANQADVKKKLQELMVINSEIDERQKNINDIQKDITHINSNIGILNSQLTTLEQQLADRKAKYIRSLRYMARHRSVQDNLMFAFSAKSLAQVYRRMRFVREYASYQKAQGELVKAKQQQVTDKHIQLEEVKGQKSSLLNKGRKEHAALQAKQGEQQKAVDGLQREQKTIQSIIAEQQKKDAVLNAEIDRLIAIEVEKARQRAIAEAKRKAEAAEAAKRKAEELARKKAAAEAAERENQRRIAEAKAREERLRAEARVAEEAERARRLEAEKAAREAEQRRARAEKETADKKAQAEREAREAAERKAKADQAARESADKQARALQAAREAEAARVAAERKAAAERERSEKAIAESKKEVEETHKLSTVDRMVSGGFEANKGRLPMPITGSYRIVSHFGQYNVEGLKNVKLDNKGINIMGGDGCQARSIYDGEVSAVFGYGGSMVVMVRHGAYISVYANLRSASVTRGQRVTTRQTLGTVGADNILQFQLRKETAKLNPETWLGR